MTNDYDARVVNHYKVQNEVTLDLLRTLQLICPGTWVLQIQSGLIFEEGCPRKVFNVSVSNGDDNVTATNKNLGAAIAQVIYYLLNGSVFPLTGNGGQYVHPLDMGYVLKEKDENQTGQETG